ncbi:hypothetical protein CLOM_g20275 [Closterium sp. NIES-68]|nr:hypothetical protein CLOM_g20275 [Closterium sp. NIES-68]GJP64365.1 hypothetical protein CLOP_g21369 [Closterium sp. NIES-67]
MATLGVAFVGSCTQSPLGTCVTSQSKVSNSWQQLTSPRVFLSATALRHRAQKLPLPARSVSQQWNGRPYVRVSVANAGICIASTSVGDVNEAIKDAAKEGDVSIVKQLLAGGNVDINLPSAERSGWTALHLAAFYEHPEIVQVLLAAGADTEARNGTGNTALQFACLKGNLDIARMLLDAGADLYATSDDKGNALEYAQEWGTEEMVDFLLVRAATEHNQE